MSNPLIDAASRCIGSVEAVAPDKLTVLLDVDAPHGTALGTGDPIRFPRINGFVLLPNEVGALVGVVTWLGIERAPYPKRTGLQDFGLVDLPFPLRRLHVNPVGTLVSTAKGKKSDIELRRGALSFPTVGDPVVLPTAEELRALIEVHDADARVFIGTSPLAGDARVEVDPDKLFGRHLAVLGNTGSGKSCSVAGLIRWSIEAAKARKETLKKNGPPNARFIILDPNGEYAETFSDIAGVRRFRVEPPDGDGSRPLQVPAWMWDSREWSAFTQATPATQRPLLIQAVRNLRAGRELQQTSEQKLAHFARGYKTGFEGILASGPEKFGNDFRTQMSCGGLLRNAVMDLASMAVEVPKASDYVEKAVSAAKSLADEQSFPYKAGKGGEGFNGFSAAQIEAVLNALEELLEQLPPVEVLGGQSEDAPIPFDTGELVDHIKMLSGMEDFASAGQYIDTMLLRIRSMLADTRLAPILAPAEYASFETWLEDYLGNDGATNGQIAVVDLSLVPADVLVLAVAVIGRIVFEALQRYRRVNKKELPTALVLEEAHTFVRYPPRDEPTYATPSRMCRETFERIAREGRKFGLGLVLSSQRPSELSATALAQCNTFLLHRIVNDRDQDLVGHLVPDNLAGLLRELPSLPSQQAILLGWAAQLPLLIRIRTLPENQRPRSADPDFWKVWTGEESRPLDWADIAKSWTGTE
jgi:DNA helicase HerA-like ATPase